MKYQAELRAIAANIIRIRREKKLTQIALALDAEISHRQLQRIEAGTTDIRHTTLLAIAEALEVKVTDLVS